MSTSTDTVIATDAAGVLTREQVSHYQKDGFVLLPRVMSGDLLALLRGGCQAAIAATDAEMDARGTDVLGISRRGTRYFCEQPSLSNQSLLGFVFSPLMEGICRALLGGNVYVFWEQYVVKGPETGLSFSWHQDSGYSTADTVHRPYLTCWCALDDMSEENGTAYILPQSRVGIRTRVEHVRDPQINDMVGYFGPDPGDPVLCSAGSIALFSSLTFHRSGSNRSPHLRRAYLIQYSSEVIFRPDGTPRGRTEPFLLDGRRVVASPGAS